MKLCTRGVALGSDRALELPHIASRYLLVMHIPLYRDAHQRRYAEPLWFKDLREHLAYLDNLTVTCPCADGTPPANMVPLDGDPRFSRVQFVDLPPTHSLAHAVLLLPATLSRLWRAVRNADIVHTGVAGWPIPRSWIIIPLARILKKHSIIVVESALWRLQHGLRRNIESRIKASLYQRLARWCLRHTDLAICTQEEYRQRQQMHRERQRLLLKLLDHPVGSLPPRARSPLVLASR
jgi:hypothetical protein